MSIAQYGRYGDNQVAHVAKGELVVPKQILRKRPDLRQEIYKEIEKYGVKGKRYVVGNKANSINPYTGQPEFFLKKILPVVTGAVGFALGGPLGASIGAGLGSAARGDNPANIATSALMGFGLGSLGAGAGLVGGKGFGAFGQSVGSLTGLGAQPVMEQGALDSAKRLAAEQATKEVAEKSLLQKAGQFIMDKPFTSGALGLGALGALGAFDEEESVSIEPPPEVGSQGMLDISTPGVTYYDKTTGEYGAASPTYPTYRPLAEGGDVIDTESRSLDDVVSNFPRKVGQIDGPGTEKSDDIPAMLSDGEFVMTAAAVRGLGALNGADKGDKLEQRRKGAKMMYEMMDKFESKVA